MARKRHWATLDDDAQEDRRDNLKRALKETKLSKSALARVLEMDVRTIRRQASGDSAIDGTAGVIYFLLSAWPKEVLAMLDADVILSGR